MILLSVINLVLVFFYFVESTEAKHQFNKHVRKLRRRKCSSIFVEFIISLYVREVSSKDFNF